MDGLLVWLRDVPPFLMYAVLAVGAAIENVVPLIPADTFVLLGGFFAAPRKRKRGSRLSRDLDIERALCACRLHGCLPLR